MDLSTLGYTNKWIKYGFLTPTAFSTQLKAFEEKSNDNAEHYRYLTFQNWLANKTSVTLKEIEQYFEIAKEDADPLMAGKALTDLFTASIISEDQFDWMKNKLPELGDWTEKLITRETLQKRLDNEVVSFDLYHECFAYKRKFKDNRLLFALIKKTDNQEILFQFESNDCGKQLKKLAAKKLAKLKR